MPDRRVDLTVENFPVVLQTAQDFTLKPYRLGSFTSGFHRFEVEKALRSADITKELLGSCSNYIGGHGWCKYLLLNVLISTQIFLFY